eukprot:g15144.t1
MLKFLHREMKGNFDLPERLAWVKEEAWKRIRRLKALEKDYEKKMQDSTSTALRQCDALERQLHQAWAKAAFKEEPTGTGKDLVACVDSVGADAVESMLRAESVAMRTAIRFYDASSKSSFRGE